MIKNIYNGFSGTSRLGYRIVESFMSLHDDLIKILGS